MVNQLFHTRHMQQIFKTSDEGYFHCWTRYLAISELVNVLRVGNVRLVTKMCIKALPECQFSIQGVQQMLIKDSHMQENINFFMAFVRISGDYEIWPKVH